MVIPMTKPTELQKPRRRLSCTTAISVCEDGHAACSTKLPTATPNVPKAACVLLWSLKSELGIDEERSETWLLQRRIIQDA